MNRRNMLKLSFLASISALAYQVFSTRTQSASEVLTVYKIHVSDNFDFNKKFSNTQSLKDVNIIEALNLKNFDSNWAINYDKVKNFCASENALIFNKKIFQPNAKTIYITSKWKDLKSYLFFLENANMSHFHKQLKISGFQPSLEIIMSSGRNIVLPEFT